MGDLHAQKQIDVSHFGRMYSENDVEDVRPPRSRSRWNTVLTHHGGRQLRESFTELSHQHPRHCHTLAIVRQSPTPCGRNGKLLRQANCTSVHPNTEHTLPRGSGIIGTKKNTHTHKKVDNSGLSYISALMMVLRTQEATCIVPYATYHGTSPPSKSGQRPKYLQHGSCHSSQRAVNRGFSGTSSSFPQPCPAHKYGRNMLHCADIVRLFIPNLLPSLASAWWMFFFSACGQEQTTSFLPPFQFPFHCDVPPHVPMNTNSKQMFISHRRCARAEGRVHAAHHT